MCFLIPQHRITDRARARRVLKALGASIGFGLSFGTTHAQSCAPGQAGCVPTNSPRSAQALQAPVRNVTAPACTVPGTWQDAFGGNRIINSNLTGTGKQPYCSAPHTLTVTLNGTTDFSLNAVWTGGSECQPYSETMTFGQTCNAASGTFVNADGSSGADTWTRVPPSVAIMAQAVMIPSQSRVQTRMVLTHSDLTLTVTSDGAPTAGSTVLLQSSRVNDDTITQPSSPTDASGMTTAKVETRKQPGTSTITSSTPDIVTGTPATITWLPAKYESDFLVTCYMVSSESDFVSTPLVGPVSGLPVANRYRRGFISDVRLQGSGVALDGSTIHYDGRGVYSLQSCPLTATGACAVDGTTAAVDRTVIPLRSTVAIASVGTRVAQDTGGAIIGYHIDEYFGTRRAACLSAGHRTLGATFMNY